MTSNFTGYLMIAGTFFAATGKWLKANADTILKLTGTFAIIGGTLIVHNYESKLSAVTLISEREQAESQLRASMFSNIITPISGPLEESGIHPHRERVLVELLALNFHENFELKPLMMHVDKRLSVDCKQNDEMVGGQAKHKKPGYDPEGDRASLRSIARRITSRQIKTLIKDNLPPPIPLRIDVPMIKIENCAFKDKKLRHRLVKEKIVLNFGETYYFYDCSREKLKNRLIKKGFKEDVEKLTKLWKKMFELHIPEIEIRAGLFKDDALVTNLVNKKIVQRKPDDSAIVLFRYKDMKELESTLMEKDLDKHVASVTDVWKAASESAYNKKSYQSRQSIEIPFPENEDRTTLIVRLEEIDADNESVEVSFEIQLDGKLLMSSEFTLTWYDFPFTDYTILTDGKRFSLVLNKMKVDYTGFNYHVELMVIWYPKDYFTARERPINYKQFRENLGI